MLDDDDDNSDPLENAAVAERLSGRGLTRFKEGIWVPCVPLPRSVIVAGGFDGYDSDFDKGIMEDGTVEDEGDVTVVVVSGALQLNIGVFLFLHITPASAFVLIAFCKPLGGEQLTDTQLYGHCPLVDGIGEKSGAAVTVVVLLIVVLVSPFIEVSTLSGVASNPPLFSPFFVLAEGDAFILEIQIACMACAPMTPEPATTEDATIGELLLRIKP